MNEKDIAELLSNINSLIWQWILGNFLTDEEETWGNREGVLQMDAEIMSENKKMF